MVCSFSHKNDKGIDSETSGTEEFRAKAVATGQKTTPAPRGTGVVEDWSRPQEFDHEESEPAVESWW